MKVDPESLRQHYRSLSDEELSALIREELIEMAQECYDEEWERRGLVETQESELVEGGEDFEEPSAESEAEPDWREDTACVASFVGQPIGSAPSDADERAWRCSVPVFRAKSRLSRWRHPAAINQRSMNIGRWSRLAHSESNQHLR